MSHGGAGKSDGPNNRTSNVDDGFIYLPIAGFACQSVPIVSTAGKPSAKVPTA